MNLLVFISNNVSLVPSILTEFMDKGIHGASVVDCEGMLQAVNSSSVEPPPIFGTLRRFINPDHEPGKMILAVLDDEGVARAKECIHKFTGTLDKPNKGILFVLPVVYAEGVL